MDEYQFIAAKVNLNKSFFLFQGGKTFLKTCFCWMKAGSQSQTASDHSKKDVLPLSIQEQRFTAISAKMSTQGASVLQQSRNIVGDLCDYSLNGVRSAKNWKWTQTFGFRSSLKKFLQCDSLKTYREWQVNKFGLRRSTEEGKMQKLIEVQDASRRAFLFTLPALLLRNSLLDLPTMATENDFSEFGPRRAPAKNAIQGLPFTTRVRRPLRGSTQSLNELEEVLALKLKFLRAKICGFNVFIDLPTATEDTPITCLQFAGSFYHEARIVKNPEQIYQNTLFRLGIGDVVTELGLSDQPSILVTLVPRGPNKDLPITVEELNIDLE